MAEAEDQDVLSVFALTKGNELYTFTIRRDFFCHAAASEEDISRWCKASKPATFSISTPHSLIAASSLQLIVSLSDGRLLQLTRKKEEDGLKWHESTYGDGQWASSLRGLVRWQGSNTVKYNDTTLEQGTPTAMILSPDKKHIFAVCLNHSLRIWNPNKATSVFSKDLLWQHREPHEIPKVMLDPGNSNVLQVFEAGGSIEGDLYYAVTFSSHDFGQFKFWGFAIQTMETEAYEIFSRSIRSSLQTQIRAQRARLYGKWQTSRSKVASEVNSRRCGCSYARTDDISCIT